MSNHLLRELRTCLGQEKNLKVVQWYICADSFSHGDSTTTWKPKKTHLQRFHNNTNTIANQRKWPLSLTSGRRRNSPIINQTSLYRASIISTSWKKPFHANLANWHSQRRGDIDFPPPLAFWQRLQKKNPSMVASFSTSYP